MDRTILVTVGLSLLNHTRRESDEKNVTDMDLANRLRWTDPVDACAETNSLSRLLQKDDALVFLHSDTEEGRRLGEVLQRHYSNKGYTSRSEQVHGLEYAESRFKLRGLRCLVATLVDLIETERKKGREVAINATGGFKAEIAYATLVGLLFRVPVYYIHEEFNNIIEFPAVPIGWDLSLVAECDHFLGWLRENLPTTEEADSRMRGLPDAVHMLLTEEEVDGVSYTTLSPAGEAFYWAYRHREAESAGVPILLSGAARRQYKDAAPDTRAKWDAELRKLRIPEMRAHQTERKHGSDVTAFPKGHKDVRIFYYEHVDDIRVCLLTRHSDGTYEDAMDKGVHSRDFDEFQLWDGG